jgi:hypothetical protein
MVETAHERRYELTPPVRVDRNQRYAATLPVRTRYDSRTAFFLLTVRTLTTSVENTDPMTGSGNEEAYPISKQYPRHRPFLATGITDRCRADHFRLRLKLLDHDR